MKSKTIVSLIVYIGLYAYFWNENRIGLHEGIDKDPKTSLHITQIVVANFHITFKASLCAIGLFIFIFLLINVFIEGLKPRIGLISREDIKDKYKLNDTDIPSPEENKDEKQFVSDMPFIFNIVPMQVSFISGTFIICAIVTVFLSIAGNYTMTNEKFDSTQGHIFIDIISVINFATFMISLVFLISKYGNKL